MAGYRFFWAVEKIEKEKRGSTKFRNIQGLDGEKTI